MATLVQPNLVSSLRGQADIMWPMAPTMNHAVGVDSLAWPKINKTSFTIPQVKGSVAGAGGKGPNLFWVRFILYCTSIKIPIIPWSCFLGIIQS